MSIPRAQAVQAFEERFGQEPAVVVRAPGRVNLIGEHTDYNQGYVLPMAIERDTVIAARPRNDGRLHIHALNLEETIDVPLTDFSRNPGHPWADYLVGVAREVHRLGYSLTGVDAVLLGDVPLGCGLSSSAALEMATLCLLESLGDFKLLPPDAAALGQRVENAFLGLKSGIMDQFASRAAVAGHALFLDCRTLKFEPVAINMTDVCFVIADSGCPRGLTSSRYNERVEQCETAVSVLAQQTGQPGTHLRDFDLDDLERARTALSETVFRRARHVITENERTREARALLAAGDAVAFGKSMSASDASLREDYAVTSPELDTLTALARALPGCFGARMTGAGFGGCTINLVARPHAEAFGIALAAGYAAATGRGATVYTTNAAAGSGLLE